VPVVIVVPVFTVIADVVPVVLSIVADLVPHVVTPIPAFLAAVFLVLAALFEILVRDLVGPLHGRLAPNEIVSSFSPFDPARFAPC
jgi:hypothetical protein